MNLSEAERQVLATLRGAELDAAPTDRANLEQRGECYWIFREDWTGAFAGLAEKGLIDDGADGYRLSEAGVPMGDGYHRERPNKYWYFYQQFYQAAHASKAHSRFCERVYGEDLCQEGLTDMAALGDMFTHLELQPGERLLDLGCGAGTISEYIADRTGAKVTGIDYSAPAIAMAATRTVDKSASLTFLQADMNDLDLPAQSFDAAISLDSFYFVADIADSLSRVIRTIKPGGRIGVFFMQDRAEGAPPEILEAANTGFGKALARLGLDYEVRDYTAPFRTFWPRAREAAIALRDDFEAEGNGFIAANWIRETDLLLPAIEADAITRYLYLLRV